MEHLNNSFPFYNQEKDIVPIETDFEERNNMTAFNLNFLKYYEYLENLNNGTKDNLNFSPNKKKNSLDMSYSIEQTFCENSHINIEEEFHNEETCKNILNL